jgi:tetratricopeptide (TPR) repeat protein
MNASQPQAVSANVITVAPNLENWCGRAAEINQLGQWLSNPQVDTIGIQGLGGAGKSSLAAYIYRTAEGFAAKFWADVSQQPDFTAFAEQAIMALGNFSRADIARLDPTQLSNILLSCLNQQRCLLVIDNLETLLDEARQYRNPAYEQFFGRWVQQGYTSVLLVTTQEKPVLLQAEPCWLLLSGLEITDGVQLLLDLGIQGELEQLTAFVRAADGHPLTLWLAAGFLRQYCQSQLSRAGELGLREFNQLADAAIGSHRQQRDIRRAWILQQHFQRLTPELRQFLLNLTVYRQAFNREAAAFMLVEGMVAANALVTQQTLQELINRSLLLAVANDCYQFQPFVLAYAQQQAADFNLAHSQAIYYWYSISTPESNWQTLTDLKPYLETFHHYCQQQEYERAYSTLNICYKFLHLRGYYAVIVELYEQLVEAWQICVQPAAKSNLGWSLTRLGLAYKSLGQYKKAIGFLEKHLSIAREISHRAGEGGALGNLGSCYYSLGQYAQAMDYYQQHLAIARKIGDRGDEGRDLSGLGNCYYSLGQYQQAIDYQQQYLAIAREIGDRGGEGTALGNLGNCYYSLGQYQQAMDYQQQYLAIAREIGDRGGEGHALGNLGGCYYSLGQYQQAMDYHQQYLAIAREIGDRGGEGRALNGLGNCYYSLGQYQQAMDYYQQYLAIAREIGDRFGEGNALRNLGLCYEQLGQRQEAIAFFYQAYQTFQSIGTEHYAAQVRSDLIRLGESL